jgi:hypothetical protein
MLEAMGRAGVVAQALINPSDDALFNIQSAMGDDDLQAGPQGGGGGGGVVGQCSQGRAAGGACFVGPHGAWGCRQHPPTAPSAVGEGGQGVSGRPAAQVLEVRGGSDDVLPLVAARAAEAPLVAATAAEAPQPAAAAAAGPEKAAQQVERVAAKHEGAGAGQPAVPQLSVVAPGGGCRSTSPSSLAAQRAPAGQAVQQDEQQPPQQGGKLESEPPEAAPGAAVAEAAKQHAAVGG